MQPPPHSSVFEFQLDEKVDNSVALAKKHPALKNGLDYWCRVRDLQKIGDNIDDRENMGVFYEFF